MTRIARQRGAHHRMDFGLRLEPFGDLKRGGAMLCETGMECPQTADRPIGVVWRYRPAGLIARRRGQFGGLSLRLGADRKIAWLGRRVSHSFALGGRRIII